VNEEAFGSPAEANLVETLRRGGYVIASLVAETEAGVVGHILFSRLTIGTEKATISAASLAPMAVAPEVQRQGIGSRLVEAGLASCRERGERIAFVLGHPAYYPRFGFSSELAKNVACSFGEGEAWMALELVPGSLSDVTGRVVYPRPFAMFE
jgi:putative acetyltransferase